MFPLCKRECCLLVHNAVEKENSLTFGSCDKYFNVTNLLRL